MRHGRRGGKTGVRHRILPKFKAGADRGATDTIIEGLLAEIPVDDATPAEKRRMDAVMR